MPVSAEARTNSPARGAEGQALARTLGPDLLARVVGIVPSDVGRYASRAYATPDPIAARLRFLVRVTEDLAGGYDETGVRRWFDRRRTALGEKAPAELLADGGRPATRGPSGSGDSRQESGLPRLRDCPPLVPCRRHVGSMLRAGTREGPRRLDGQIPELRASGLVRAERGAVVPPLAAIRTR